ncbi:MAG: PAS domain S-box protein [bacterium]|nr:PAS domain S-box protein [bacterium]
MLTEEALAETSFRIKSCSDLSCALELLRKQHFDVILLDLGLPDSQGLETLRTLRQMNPQSAVVVLVLTGNDDEELALQALKEGAQDYLVKNDLGSASLRRAIRYAVERKTFENNLKRSEQRVEELTSERTNEEFKLHAILDNASDSIILLDDEQRVITFNRAAEKTYGYLEAEVIGQPIYLLVAEGEREARKELLQSMLRGELPNPEGIEATGLRKDGTLFPTDISFSEFTLGDRHYIVRISRDATERRKRETRLRAILDNASDGIITIDESGNIQSFNRAAEAIYGYSEKQIQGQSAYQLLPEHNRQPFRDLIDRMCQGEMRMFRSLESTGLRQNGTTFPLELSLSSSEIGDKSIIIGLHRDITEREAIREALLLTQRRMENAQQRAHVGNWEVNLRTGRAIWSAELFRIYGREQGISLDLTQSIDWTHPEDRDRVQESVQAAIQRGGEFALEYRIVRPDGQLRYVEALGGCLLDSAGVPVILQGTVQDVTATKLSEVALVHSRVRMQHAQQVAHVGDFEWNTETNESSWSDEYFRILGLEPGSLQPDYAKAMEFVHPDDRESVNETARLGLANGGSTLIDYRLVRPDGQIRYVEGRAEFPVPDAESGLVPATSHLITGTILDVTERKKSELQLLAILDNVSDAIVTFDTRGVIHTFNKSAELIFGHTTLEMMGREVFELLSEDTREAIRDRVKGMCAGIYPETYCVDADALRNNDVRFPCELKLNMFAAGDKHLVLCSVRDLTTLRSNADEKEKLEEQLRQSQKMEAVGKLAGGVAHDFNNMLSVINGYCEMALMDLNAAEPLHEYVTEILSAGERAALITSQLLAFSRQTVLAPRVLELNKIVLETSKMLRRLVGEDINISTSLDARLHKVLVDPGHLLQVIMNLAVNARDAMPQGGKLTLQTYNEDVSEVRAPGMPDGLPVPYVVLSVSDNGSGMDPEVQQRIFEPFYTTKPVGEGTGLGLSTVYGIVAQSGGRIAVYSEVGHGTSFVIHLPAIVADEAQSIVREEFTPLMGTETILLVEDDPQVSKIAMMLLERHGYTVLLANCGDSAITLAQGYGKPIHLMLTDLIMPGMSGRRVAEEVLLVLPDVKVIFMSGYTDDALVRNGLISDSVAFIQKPFTSVMLTNKVRQVLDGTKVLA